MEDFPIGSTVAPRIDDLPKAGLETRNPLLFAGEHDTGKVSGKTDDGKIVVSWKCKSAPGGVVFGTYLPGVLQKKA